MKFSVIIPTNNPQYLQEAVLSVFRQTVRDFEIVILKNGLGAGTMVSSMPDITEEQWNSIRIVKWPPEGDERVDIAIGAIKKVAFTQGRGDYLVELDHDDLLAPDCLEHLLAAFEGPEKPDFVYGNSADFSDEGYRVAPYEESWGWKNRPVQILGRNVIETRAFPPKAVTFAKVYWSPNHPRAWRRTFYQEIGGHAEELRVCDDHDLMAISYIKGKVVHVDRCLYLYRRHPNNTIEKMQKEIERATWGIYARTIERMVLREMKDRKLPAFSIFNPASGWEDGVPGWHDPGPFHPVEPYRLPWPDNSVGAFKFQETLPLFDHPSRLMSELHRCLAPGGWILSSTPSASGKGAFANPRFRTFFNDLSFRYYTDRAFASQIGNTKVRFQPQRLEEFPPTPFHKEHNIPIVFFDGIALKDGYEGPGPKDI